MSPFICTHKRRKTDVLLFCCLDVLLFDSLVFLSRYTKNGGVVLIIDGKQFDPGQNFWSSEEHEKTRNELAQKLENAIQKVLHSSSVSKFKIRMVRSLLLL